MKFTETKLSGLLIVDLTELADERGFFARSWCSETFAKQGLETALLQCSVSFNIRKGTVRGMHYQDAPHGEVKLVRCTRGAIFDAVVDIRPDSVSFGQWFGLELSADNHRAFYIPAGFAHGFQTLTENAEVFYQISTAYVPAASRGIAHDDPAIGISWPLPVAMMSDRDRHLPRLRP